MPSVLAQYTNEHSYVCFQSCSMLGKLQLQHVERQLPLVCKDGTNSKPRLSTSKCWAAETFCMYTIMTNYGKDVLCMPLAPVQQRFCLRQLLVLVYQVVPNDGF